MRYNDLTADGKQTVIDCLSALPFTAHELHEALTICSPEINGIFPMPYISRAEINEVFLTLINR